MNLKVRRSKVWNLHSHSKFSANDALPSVDKMVATAKRFGQPALGLTDHGNMAGTVQLYTNAMKAGIKPFPGSELYIVHDRNDKKAKRHHMCVVAYTTEGYQNLVRLSTQSYRNFYHRPILDHADLAEASEAGLLKGIAATSGCYYGFIAQAMTKEDFSTARQLMRAYNGWFDRFYVELQNHNIDHGDGWTDDLLANELYFAAFDLGIPAVLTQDSHYCEHDDQETHNAFKRLVAYGDDPDDAVFPGDGFGLADLGWFMDHHNESRFRYGQDGLVDLLDAWDLSIPQLDHYSYNIPITVDDPDSELEHRTRTVLEDMRLDKERKYVDRLADELSIIKDTGMAGYLLLVQEVTDWCRQNKIFYQARGSASGSISNWLLGITQVDPLKWGLSFERFISRDRTKPPDIDLDIEHERRAELIEWLRGRFSVTQIGTWSEYSIHGEEEDEAKGSILRRYYGYRNRIGAATGEWDLVPDEDKAELLAIAQHKPFASYGTGAAGLVVTTTEEELTSLVPMMLVASSDTWVTQYDKDDIERLGLVKLDVMGVKTLTVLHKCMDNLGRDIHRGLDWIPLSDTKTYQSISRGETEGVFQLEGGSAKYGCKRLKPTKIGDVIAAMALFRPATQDSGATASYINRRSKKEGVPQRNSIIEKHTSRTYGIMLFQEQVIDILRDLGMTPDDLTAFLKAVKASNSAIGDAGHVIAAYRDDVHRMAKEKHFSDEDWEWLWEAIEGFAAYGFNQAHSTVYGLTAYRCAYLATNFPVEFFAAQLAVAGGTPKESRYVLAARRRGISIRRADINISAASYGMDTRHNAIRKGFTAIKGIGEPTAKKIIAARPEEGFTSMEEFCRLSKVSGSGPYLNEGVLDVGIVGKLYEAGTLDSIMEGS